MDLKPIERIVASCEYRNINPLREEMSLARDPKRIWLRINNFYRYDKPTRIGMCSELMNFIYLHPSLRKTQLRLLRAQGQDTEFYFSENSSHWFLLVTDEDIMRGKGCIDDPEKISMMLGSSDHVMLVDPSFKKIVEFPRSGYTVKKIFNQGHPINYYNNVVLEQEEKVPIGMTANKKIVFLSYSQRSKSLMRILIRGRRMPGKDYEGIWQDNDKPRAKAFPEYDLMSGSIDSKLAGETEIMKVINALRSKKVTTTININNVNINDEIPIC